MKTEKLPSLTKPKKKYTYRNTWDYDPKRYHAIREVYNDQIDKFKRLGIGGTTEFGTVVTQDLIDITIKRRDELNVITRKNCKKNVAKAKFIEKKYSFKKEVA
jgi:hypothetical protein